MKLVYKQLLENVSDWLWEIDINNNYIYCSDSVSKFLGFDASEVVGKTLFDFMSETEAKKVSETIALHTINKEAIVACENIYIHKDGHEVTATTNAVPIFDENGEVSSFQGIVKDITQEKKAKSEAIIIAERLKLALHGSNDGIWDWNMLDDSVYFSPRWKEMIGYRDDELKNEFSTWENRIHPDDIQEIWNVIQTHIESKKGYYESIHRLEHKDGHWVWILDRGKAFYDTDGKATRMIGTHTDISEKKALQLRAVHQNQIIEQIHDSVISTDMDAVITGWNKGAEIIYGYTSEEAIGQHVGLIYLKEELETLSKHIDILAKNGSQHAIIPNLTKSGEILTVDVSLSLLRDEQNNPIGMVGYAKDITKTRKAEHALEQQSRMVQMGEMISMIAHQWRQPLNAISLTASNLNLKFDLDEYDFSSKKDVNQCSQDFSTGLENIQEYVINLSATIDDFRNFYKTEKITVLTKLENIVEKSLKIIGMSLVKDKIEIIKEYQSDEIVALYENEIMQVIMTVFKNAQDNFLEKGTKEPSIKIFIEGKKIFICDNGGGVPKKIIDKVFDPYFSTKLDKNGTGLGLYMSKTIIEDHHKGKLSIKNKNDGACVTIEFP